MDANTLINLNAHKQLVAKSISMPAGYLDDYHQHPWHQVIFPVSGLLQSDIGDLSMVVPHNALLFIPAGTSHKSVAVTQTEFVALYLNPTAKVPFCRTLKSCLVTPFFKELVLLLLKTADELDNRAISNLLRVLNDQINSAANYEIPLLKPTDRRILAIFEQLIEQPATQLTLVKWAQQVGASERTLSRLFAKEFNQSFSAWRQHLRLVLSLGLLTTPRSIQDIALSLGFASDAAYIQAFKALFLSTPHKYRNSVLQAKTT
ncbi:helix-turn-helix transcriptional regulator [Pseudoalteromonas luteoviolacea]|uniref:AraC family transcriptional regulator n=1 Tax=Pseudoalteromonas luteoviolacea TaxID=43657 RepID=UPI001B36A14D|nr:helix-turn-helix transcriptional regulator [Pseudoalteromonas luteoviolacea]MBQ4813660.1 helix-turn-helix transcriptional regulator [Pseudoalteromonas luteoviolacea]